jgi:hypothetical protein
MNFLASENVIESLPLLNISGIKVNCFHVID